MLRIPNCRPGRKSGFTLIELLVVIAIIAILAAILFPVFARARENARRASCQSNLKQIGLGIMQYSQDYDEKMPFSYLYLTPGADLVWWEDTIQPYVKSYQIMVCPSQSSPTAYTWARPATGYPNPLMMSYVANRINNIPGSPTPVMPDGSLPAVSIASFAEPATTILLAEAISGKSELVYWQETQSGGCPAVEACITDQRHLDGENYAWVDGHVKWLKTTTPSMWTTVSD